MEHDQPPVADAVCAGWTCAQCGTTGAVRTGWRFNAEAMGRHALAGTRLKLAARRLPVAQCRPDLGGCGHELRGEPA